MHRPDNPFNSDQFISAIAHLNYYVAEMHRYGIIVNTLRDDETRFPHYVAMLREAMGRVMDGWLKAEPLLPAMPANCIQFYDMPRHTIVPLETIPNKEAA